jgi:hypothetical protein
MLQMCPRAFKDVPKGVLHLRIACRKNLQLWDVLLSPVVVAVVVWQQTASDAANLMDHKCIEASRRILEANIGRHTVSSLFVGVQHALEGA